MSSASSCCSGSQTSLPSPALLPHALLSWGPGACSLPTKPEVGSHLSWYSLPGPTPCPVCSPSHSAPSRSALRTCARIAGQRLPYCPRAPGPRAAAAAEAAEAEAAAGAQAGTRAWWGGRLRPYGDRHGRRAPTARADAGKRGPHCELGAAVSSTRAACPPSARGSPPRDPSRAAGGGARMEGGTPPRWPAPSRASLRWAALQRASLQGHTKKGLVRSPQEPLGQ